MLTPEPFAVVQLRPGVEDDRPGPAQLVDRLEVKRFRFGPVAQQRAHRGLDAPCPFLRARARPLGQAREGELCRGPVAAPYRCLDQLALCLWARDRIPVGLPCVIDARGAYERVDAVAIRERLR